mmetsp:Transcript_38737/g.44051  ORF Transcript_38737/g.44051 Transcript_38737/m.44051 type:complete len:376 (-) Transcript_38737:94-1221(-)
MRLKLIPLFVLCLVVCLTYVDGKKTCPYDSVAEFEKELKLSAYIKYENSFDKLHPRIMLEISGIRGDPNTQTIDLSRTSSIKLALNKDMSLYVDEVVEEEPTLLTCSESSIHHVRNISFALPPQCSNFDVPYAHLLYITTIILPSFPVESFTSWAEHFQKPNFCTSKLIDSTKNPLKSIPTQVLDGPNPSEFTLKLSNLYNHPLSADQFKIINNVAFDPQSGSMVACYVRIGQKNRGSSDIDVKVQLIDGLVSTGYFVIDVAYDGSDGGDKEGQAGLLTWDDQEPQRLKFVVPYSPKEEVKDTNEFYYHEHVEKAPLPWWVWLLVVIAGLTVLSGIFLVTQVIRRRYMEGKFRVLCFKNKSEQARELTEDLPAEA